MSSLCIFFQFQRILNACATCRVGKKTNNKKKGYPEVVTPHWELRCWGGGGGGRGWREVGLFYVFLAQYLTEMEPDHLRYCGNTSYK